MIALETSKTAKHSEFLRHERWRMSFSVEFLLLHFYEVHMGTNHGEAYVQQRGLGTWVTSLFLMSRLNERMNHPISFYPGKEKRERVSERDGIWLKPEAFCVCSQGRGQARQTHTVLEVQAKVQSLRGLWEGLLASCHCHPQPSPPLRALGRE